MDGTITRSVWGLFTVGREDLHRVSHFTMHTTTSEGGTHTESLHAMTRDGSREVLADSRPGLLGMVAELNSHLDQPAPGVLTLHRTAWAWFTCSWMLLMLGGLILVRNVLIPAWRRRRPGTRSSRG
jgi:hypothetical protein